MEINPELAYPFLDHLTDDELRMAITKIIEGRTEMYPSSNWIAWILQEVNKCSKCDGRGTYVTHGTGGDFNVKCSCQ